MIMNPVISNGILVETCFMNHGCASLNLLESKRLDIQPRGAAAGRGIWKAGWRQLRELSLSVKV